MGQKFAGFPSKNSRTDFRKIGGDLRYNNNHTDNNKNKSESE